MNNELLRQQTNIDLDRHYGENNAWVEYLLDLNKSLYDLPTFSHTDEVTNELFNYCERRKFFVNIIAFQNDKVFLTRSLGSNLGWQLPGSAVKSKGREHFEDAVTRILENHIPGVEVTQIRPIAHLDKRYSLGAKMCTHSGLAFVARVLKPTPEEIEKNEDIKGQFVRIGDLSEMERINPFEKQILSVALRLHRKSPTRHLESIDAEISSTQEIPKWTHKIDSRLIRPFGRRFSSEKIKKQILHYLKPEWRVLDVACGDDDFVYTIAQKCDLCIANDIQWQQIRKLNEQMKAKKYTHGSNIGDVVFSNHDACDLPFATKFDLTLCKNVIHHMSSRVDLDSMSKSLQRVSHRVLLVDPEDPKSSGIKSKLWNTYYRVFLKDQGDHFFTAEDFEKFSRHLFPTAVLNFEYVKTIKGRYMFCLVDFTSSNTLDKVENGAVEETLALEYKNNNDGSMSKDPKAIQAVIFDFDGLIVDSEQVFIRAIERALISSGVHDFSPVDYISRDLQKGTSLLEDLKTVGKISDIETTQNLIYEEYWHLLQEKVVPMPGAIESIKRLKSHFRLAIASSSKRKFLEYMLDKLEIQDYFEVIVAREDTLKHKPDPECLQLVLDKLNLPSTKCVLVEDSNRGIQAGRAIGLQVIAVPSDLTQSTLEMQNEIILTSLSQLSPELLRNI